MKLIYLEWEDAQSWSEGRTIWKKKSEVEEYINHPTLIIKEVGFLFKETKKYLAFVSRISPDNKYYTEGYAGIMKIPKPWIMKRIDLTKYIK